MIAILLGLLYRIRGGLFNLPSTTLGRLLWTFGLYGAAMVYLPFIWWHAPIMFLTIFAAHSWVGHGQWMTMGRNKDQTDAYDNSNVVTRALMKIIGVGTVKSDLLGMSFLGLLRHMWILPLAIADLCHFVYILGGLAHGPIYWVAWKIPSKIKGFKQGTGLAEGLIGLWHGALLTFLSVSS